MVIVAAVELQ